MQKLLRPLLLTSSLALFTACEKAEPVSYLIPKEDRSVDMPSAAPASDPAKQAPATTAAPSAQTAAPTTMQVLPGMAEAAAQAGELTYTVPTGWEELAPSGIRKVNLKVTDDNGTAELTVLAFPGDVGGRLANINRWRGQIGLEPVTEDELPTVTEGYTISNHRGLYVKLEGAMDSILGGLLPFHGYTWFFKLQGNTDTVLANEAKMKAFIDSVQLQDDHH